MTRGEDAPRVAADLLAVLRERLGTPGPAYAEPPSRISGGYDTAVYGLRLDTMDGLDGAGAEFAQPLILRCFRDGAGQARARSETAVQNLVAGLGYPCPRVLLCGDEATVDGAHFTLMERVPGEPMVSGLLRPSVLALRIPGMMGELHARLHEIDPSPLVDAAAEEGLSPADLSVDASIERMAQGAARIGASEAQPALGWLRANRPPDPPGLAICHADFHPLNILMDDGAPTGVIDWANVRIADPAYDVARTAIIARHAPLNVPQPLRAVFPLFRRVLVAGYLRGYRGRRPVDARAYRYYLALNVLTLYLAGRESGVSSEPTGGAAWAAPGVPQGLARRFRALSGVALDAGGTA